ncbi:unnamed protein product [Hyaloperonospora brassicae]|uniref:RING-type E3 ubiquitin transferase n=1 Tax=Hyaloperonospora brassicae TaxID=162125 RepID=A0AAV0V4E6_HYABA|nr:unnamed protein product [Hyaloperonospora brassicae]
MSLGDRAAAAATQDEEDWAARGDHAAVIAAHEAQEAVDTIASASGRATASVDAVDERTRAADFAVLGDTCPICLQTLEDPVMVKVCYHVYCFDCLSTWVHSMALHGVESATCPMCKASFQEVYANVRSESDYQVIGFRGKHMRGDRYRSGRRDQRGGTCQRIRRRSLVYRRHMRLVRVAGEEVADTHAFPTMRKVQGEYESWLTSELKACIGRDVDLTVLLALIRCCLNKVVQCGAKACYDELQQALLPFLYEDATHFVQELAYFLASRLNVEAYDAAVEYRCENAAECTNELCCGR